MKSIQNKTKIQQKKINNEPPKVSQMKYINKFILDRNLLNEEDRKYIYINFKKEYVFDFEFYKKLYAHDFKTDKLKCFNTRRKFRRIGCEEEYKLRYKSNLTILKKLLNKLEKEISNSKTNVTCTDDNLINIIIRTHRREQNFTKCINSIASQTYQNIRLLISVDDDFTQNYVENIKKNSNIKQFEIFRFEPKKDIEHWFNDYINSLFKKVKSGYVIIIDDDNYLSSNYCLEYLIKKSCKIISNNKNKNKNKNENKNETKPLVINFLYFRNDTFAKIDTSSVFFHSDILKSGEIKMGVHMGGDHLLFDGLKNNGKIIQVKQPLVRVTYDDYVTGGGKIFEN